MPVVPAIQEAEAVNCLNLGGGGCSELKSHHCTPAWVTEPDSISKIKKNKNIVYMNENKDSCPQNSDPGNPGYELHVAFVAGRFLKETKVKRGVADTKFCQEFSLVCRNDID